MSATPKPAVVVTACNPRSQGCFDVGPRCAVARLTSSGNDLAVIKAWGKRHSHAGYWRKRPAADRQAQGDFVGIKAHQVVSR